MYIAGLLNANKVFQTAASLGDTAVTDLLFRATSAVIHIARMRQLHSAIVAEYSLFAPELKTKRTRIAFFSPNVVGLANEIPPFLNVIRLMQDMIMPMVARVLKLKLSVPSSLHDCMKHMATYGFPDAVVLRTNKYWEESGKVLKNYRDLDQHLAAVVNNTLFEIEPSPRFLFLLPDDPKERQQSNMTFNREINALEYLPAAFQALHEWVEDLATLLGGKAVEISQSMQMGQPGQLVPPVEGTFALFVDQDLVNGKPRLRAIDFSADVDGRLTLSQSFKEIGVSEGSEKGPSNA